MNELLFIAGATAGVVSLFACFFSAGWVAAGLWSRRFIRLPDGRAVDGGERIDDDPRPALEAEALPPLAEDRA